MCSNVATPHESRDGRARCADAAGPDTLRGRLATGAARLFRTTRRPLRRWTTDPNSSAGQPSWPGRQHVLRDYHAANLAAARAGSEDLVRAGFNTGEVPYGYRAHRVQVTPAGRRPRWRTRLTIEPVEAATVRMIFVWRGEDRLSVPQIRSRLGASRYPAPLDPATGQPTVWTVATVRSILHNPKYLGRQVWGRRHRGRPAPEHRWVWSSPWAHPPIVDHATFAAVQHPRQGSHDPTQTTKNPEQAP